MSATKIGRFGRKNPLDARWTTTERPDSPLLVCLPGGGYDSRYFDVPGHSLLERASAAGFPALALTRPGHPADEQSARAQPSFSEAAAIISEAIAEAWQQLGDGRPGVVLLGHSIGGAVAVHMAAQAHSWPLLGLTVSAVGDTVSPQAMGQFTQFPPDIAVDFPFEAVRPVLFGPEWTLHDTSLTDVAGMAITTPSADMVEMGSRWTDDLPKIAREVTVPVQYVLAEFDQFWIVSNERVDGFAALFSGAPFVDASLWRGTGHNIEHHQLGRAYVHAVLAFAERCAMEPLRP